MLDIELQLFIMINFSIEGIVVMRMEVVTAMETLELITVTPMEISTSEAGMETTMETLTKESTTETTMASETKETTMAMSMEMVFIHKS